MKEPISIMEILAIVIKRGRAILCMALVGAVLGGIYQYRKGILASQQVNTVAEQSYTQAMEAYQKEKQPLEKELASYQDGRASLEYYFESSILMSLNRWATPTSVIAFSIDDINSQVDEVEDKLTEHSILRVSTAYQQYWEQLLLSETLLNHPYVGMREDFLREITNFNYMQNGIFTITAYGATLEDAHALCESILASLMEVKGSISGATVDHNIKVISHIDKIADTLAVAEAQQRKKEEKNKVEENIARLTEEIAALEEPQRASGYDFSSMYKKVIIFAVIGAVLFAGMVCVWALVMYIVSDGVESSGQMAAIIGAPFLANTAGKQSMFVRWANALIGERYWADSASAAMYAVACIQKDVPDGAGVAVVSTLKVTEEDEGVKRFAEELRASGYQVTVVNNATLDPAAVRLLRECGNVVMAERVGKSARKQLVDLKNVIAQMDGKLLGFVLV